MNKKKSSGDNGKTTVPKGQPAQLSILVRRFHQQFELVPADTPRLIEQVIDVRARAYLERQKNPAGKQVPAGAVRDHADVNAAHWLVTDRASGGYAACVRLVHSAEPDCQPLFPHERDDGAHLDSRLAALADIQRFELCEISRLAVLRRFEDIALSVGAAGPAALRCPLAGLGIVLSALYLGFRGGFKGALMLMGRDLGLCCQRLGLGVHAWLETPGDERAQSLFFIQAEGFNDALAPQAQQDMQAIVHVGTRD